LQFGLGRDLFAVLGHPAPRAVCAQAPLHTAGNQPLGLRAGAGQPFFHQKNIGTLGFHKQNMALTP
jgi:hypothetical protein